MAVRPQQSCGSMRAGPRTCLLRWRTAQLCCLLKWIAAVSASVDNACCTSTIRAKKGSGAGAACNYVETGSRSPLTQLADAWSIRNNSQAAFHTWRVTLRPEVEIGQLDGKRARLLCPWSAEVRLWEITPRKRHPLRGPRFHEPVQWDSRPADFGPPSKQPNVASVRPDRAAEYRLASDSYRDRYQRGNPRTIRPEANAV